MKTSLRSRAIRFNSKRITCGRRPRRLRRRRTDVGTFVMLGIFAQLVGEENLTIVQTHVVIVAKTAKNLRGKMQLFVFLLNARFE